MQVAVPVQYAVGAAAAPLPITASIAAEKAKQFVAIRRNAAVMQNIFFMRSSLIGREGAGADCDSLASPIVGTPTVKRARPTGKCLSHLRGCHTGIAVV